MECGVFHKGERSRPTRRSGVLGNRVAYPCLGPVVDGHQLLEREGLPDATAQFSRDNLELRGQAVSGHGIARRRLEAAVAVFPLSSRDVDHYRHGRRTYPLRGAANRRPRWTCLGEDPLAQLVARTGQRERHVRVQTLHAPGTGARTAHA